MAEIARTNLFGTLNCLAYEAIEGATIFCKMRGNPNVELVHWLYKLFQLEESDLRNISRYFDIDASRLDKGITRALDKLPRGATSISDLSPQLEHAAERGWVYATLLFGDVRVRTGYLLVGILKDRNLSLAVRDISDQFEKINVDTLIEKFATIVRGSSEEGLSAVTPIAATADGSTPTAERAEGALEQYSVDLTEKARCGEIDAIVGRDDEIRQMIDILMRRRQNNPILTGEAGVGKTAVVEGFALRVAADEVPPPLKNVIVRALDLGALTAGTGVRGEFEKRLKQVIADVQSSAQRIILFIDEAHMLLGAGGARGTGDAANLIKPELARGTLRTIAATTLSEYREIEKDPALERRFQEVRIKEPDDASAVLMMRSMASVMEKHHRVQILDEALQASVALSHRYIPGRQLPDKSVGVLDTACARVAVSQHAVPNHVENCRSQIHALETELVIIGNDEASGVKVKERRSEAQSKLTEHKDRLEELNELWKAELGLVDEILDVRSKLRGFSKTTEETPSNRTGPEKTETESRSEAPRPDSEVAVPQAVEPSRSELFDRLGELQSQLLELQKDRPLILPTVDERAIASVVADWTGVPVGHMVRDEIQAVLGLAETLNERVLGQSHALKKIADRIQTSRTKLDNPKRPVGVFLFCGPSGVGKTETALALADAMYGGEENVITVNMNEFQSKETIASLIGAAPGLVGYEEGGALTEPVRKRPYSIVLLDEFEKADKTVHRLFYDVFDKGNLKDAKGRFIDFRNTIILLTTNVGDDQIIELCRDPDTLPEPDNLAEALNKPLRDVFPAAFLNRVTVVPYYPLTNELISKITKLQLRRIEERISAQYKVPFTYDDDVVRLVNSRCTQVESGARLVEAIIVNTILPRISRELLARTMDGREIEKVHVTVENDDFQFTF